MSVNPTSRYGGPGGKIVRMPNSEGVYNLSVLRTIQGSSIGFRLYIWQAADRPDLVAWQFFQDPTLWWAIFDMNPELIYPLNIKPGTLVRIPLNPVLPSQSTIFQ